MSAIIDQTRPDQTRPDQTATHGLKSFKEFLKRHDRFHIIFGAVRLLRATKNNTKRYIDGIRFDKKHTNPESSKHYDRIPYIIPRESTGAGLFSFFNTILPGIAYADRKNYIPVVDLMNYPNTYLYPDEVGHVNAWEYYFEQPGGISVGDALSCREYITGRDAHYWGWGAMLLLGDLDANREKIEFWRKLCRKYIRFTRPVLERVAEMEKNFAGRKILGVLVRGTDYVAMKPKNHPIPPTAEQAIAKAKEVMSEKGFDSVYLATEDKNILAKFQAAFKEKLLLPNADYLDYDYNDPKYIAYVSSDRENDKYLRGLEYLVSMLFLSKCPGLLACVCGGAVVPVLFSEGFEYLHIFHLGVYP